MDLAGIYSLILYNRKITKKSISMFNELTNTISTFLLSPATFSPEFVFISEKNVEK